MDKSNSNIINKLEETSSKSFIVQMILITVLTYISVIAVISLTDLLVFNATHGGISIIGFIGYFLSTSVLLFIPIAVFSSLLIIGLTLPIIRIMKRNENGEHIPEEEFLKAKKRTDKLPEIIFIANIIFPLIINFIAAVVVRERGLDNITTVFRTISVFLLAGIAQNAAYQKTMMKPRAILKTYSVDGNQRNWFARKLERFQLYATIFFICGILFYSATAIVETFNSSSGSASGVLNNETGSMFQIEDNVMKKMRESMTDSGKVAKAEEKLREAIASSPAENGTRTKAMFLLILIMITGCSVAVDAIVSNSKKTQIGILRAVLSDMASGSGDLTRRVLIVQADEIGVLSHQLNKVLDRFQQMFKNITSQTLKVAESSKEISAVLENTVAATEEMAASVKQINVNNERNGSIVANSQKSLTTMLESLEQISSNVNTQAAYVEQTSSAMTEMIANIKSVNEVTEKANDVSESLKKVSDDGGQAVTNSIEAVRNIEASSVEVNGLIAVISKILAQTNMLAMNAAIEAAHAGDAGRGFAVVAQEVRNLADDSSGNLKSISENMKNVLDRVTTGVKLSETAGEALKQVGEQTLQTTRLMNEVAAAMKEQAAGANEVLDSIRSLVEASSTINRLSEEQHGNNELMKENLEKTINAFTEVQAATKELALGNREILNGIDELKQVIEKNESVVTAMQEELGGYRI